MARGWESKNVESQQEEAARGRKRQRPLTPEEQARQVKRQGLELARARALADLERAVVPAHRQMLGQAVSAIEAQLRDLSSS
jgi:hypothetical protein